MIGREYEIELDRNNGVLHYDVEFKVGNVEYDYEIDAQTGDICEREREVDTKSEVTTLLHHERPPLKSDSDGLF